MTLTLRCIRCGELNEMDPTDLYLRGLCLACIRKHPMPLSSPRAARWMERWQKNMMDHPTFWALAEALDALEAVPPGTLDVNDIPPDEVDHCSRLP